MIKSQCVPHSKHHLVAEICRIFYAGLALRIVESESAPTQELEQGDSALQSFLARPSRQSVEDIECMYKQYPEATLNWKRDREVYGGRSPSSLPLKLAAPRGNRLESPFRVKGRASRVDDPIFHICDSGTTLADHVSGPGGRGWQRHRTAEGSTTDQDRETHWPATFDMQQQQ